MDSSHNRALYTSVRLRTYSGQVVHTHVPLSRSSLIWVQVKVAGNVIASLVESNGRLLPGFSKLPAESSSASSLVDARVVLCEHDVHLYTNSATEALICLLSATKRKLVVMGYRGRISFTRAVKVDACSGFV